MKKLLTILCFIATAGMGCKKMLNEPDHSTLPTSMVFNSYRDLDNLLYGAYGAIANGATVSGHWRIAPEVLADHVVLNVTEQLADDPYPALYNRDMINAQYPGSWQLAYTAIQNVNTVIYAIDNNFITQEKDPEFNISVRNRIMGEALFIRGLVYFELVRLYGHQFGFNSTAPNSGVILRTTPFLNVTSPTELKAAIRSTVDSTYRQVIADLTQAEQLMPATAFRRGRATNYAASAYLARVYFQQNDFVNAMVQIRKVIGDVPGSIETSFKLSRLPATGTVTVANAASNVTAAFINSGTADKVPENIFDLVNVTNSDVSPVLARKYLRTAAIEPHLAISNAFIAEAAFAANDARKVALITTANGKNYSKKYDRALMNLPVIRSAELLLDRAEILALSGNVDGATKDINLIRDRAIPGYNINTVISPANILAEVRRERVRELAFEGDRLHNLRRMNMPVGAGDRAGVTPIPWNSNKLLLKIPQAETEVSTGVIQNPD